MPGAGTDPGSTRQNPMQIPLRDVSRMNSEFGCIRIETLRCQGKNPVQQAVLREPRHRRKARPEVPGSSAERDLPCFSTIRCFSSRGSTAPQRHSRKGGNVVIAGVFHLCATTVGIRVYEKIPEPFGPILERSADQELCVWSGRQFVVPVISVMFATSSMASSFRAMVILLVWVCPFNRS